MEPFNKNKTEPDSYEAFVKLPHIRADANTETIKSSVEFFSLCIKLAEWMQACGPFCKQIAVDTHWRMFGLSQYYNTEHAFLAKTLKNSKSILDSPYTIPKSSEDAKKSLIPRNF
jgi:hypothetical protein